MSLSNWTPVMAGKMNIHGTAHKSKWDLFLSPSGRIGRKAFFVQWIVATLICFVLLFVPLVNIAALLLGSYIMACLVAKRLRDIGLPGKLVLAPCIIFCVLLVFALFEAAMNSLGQRGASNSAENLFNSVLYVTVAFIILLGLVPSKASDVRLVP